PIRRSANLIEKFIDGLAEAFQPARLRDGQVRIGDVPRISRDLILDEPVLDHGAADAGPPVTIAEQYVHRVRDLRHEVVDVAIPSAVIGRAEEELRVIVQQHEAHVVQCAYDVSALEIAFQQIQQAANTLTATGHERNDRGQLRYAALARADAASAL